MAEFIQKYLWENLSQLFEKYRYDDFNFQNAVKLLNHDKNYTGAILGKLGNSGYISKRPDPSDGRKKIYKINKVKFEDIMKNFGKNSQNVDQ
jgi:DNA-binding MarR family transcriptional regulator